MCSKYPKSSRISSPIFTRKERPTNMIAMLFILQGLASLKALLWVYYYDCICFQLNPDQRHFHLHD
jgi:hypothetical protein